MTRGFDTYDSMMGLLPLLRNIHSEEGACAVVFRDDEFGIFLDPPIEGQPPCQTGMPYERSPEGIVNSLLEREVYPLIAIGIESERVLRYLKDIGQFEIHGETFHIGDRHLSTVVDDLLYHILHE